MSLAYSWSNKVNLLQSTASFIERFSFYTLSLIWFLFFFLASLLAFSYPFYSIWMFFLVRSSNRKYFRFFGYLYYASGFRVAIIYLEIIDRYLDGTWLAQEFMFVIKWRLYDALYTLGFFLQREQDNLSLWFLTFIGGRSSFVSFFHFLWYFSATSKHARVGQFTRLIW